MLIEETLFFYEQNLHLIEMFEDVSNTKTNLNVLDQDHPTPNN